MLQHRRPKNIAAVMIFNQNAVSREWLDLKSHDFTDIVTPVGLQPYRTSPYNSSQKLSTFEKGPKMTPATASI